MPRDNTCQSPTTTTAECATICWHSSVRFTSSVFAKANSQRLHAAPTGIDQPRQWRHSRQDRHHTSPATEKKQKSLIEGKPPLSLGRQAGSQPATSQAAATSHAPRYTSKGNSDQYPVVTVLNLTIQIPSTTAPPKPLVVATSIK